MWYVEKVLLVADIGNSEVSIGVVASGKVLHRWRCETRRSRTADEYLALVEPWLRASKIDLLSLEQVAICSVVPPVEEEFERFSRRHLNISPYKVRPDGDLNFKLNVDHPAEVGADRIANAAYARKFLKLPAVVVDLGTATTFDVVSAEGNYEGGVILPGMRMGLDALGSRTAQLPLIAMGKVTRVIGKNTVDCLRAGAIYGYQELIDGLLRRTVEELSAPTSIVLTGGLAHVLHGQLRHKAELNEDLTLLGVAILASRSE